jgi:hypothetical protein
LILAGNMGVAVKELAVFEISAGDELIDKGDWEVIESNYRSRCVGLPYLGSCCLRAYRRVEDGLMSASHTGNQRKSEHLRGGEE